MLLHTVGSSLQQRPGGGRIGAVEKRRGCRWGKHVRPGEAVPHAEVSPEAVSRHRRARRVGRAPDSLFYNVFYGGRGL